MIEQIVGWEAARKYYAGRTVQKGGMMREVFGTVAWGDVVEALKDQSNMFKIWYAKQGSGFCRVGYRTSKWEKIDKTTKEEETEASRCPSCDMKQEKATLLNRCKNSSRRADF